MVEGQLRIRLLESPRNIGFAAGCNRGATAATADRLAFVNPDCVLASGTFGAILDVFDAQPQAWLVAACSIPMVGNNAAAAVKSCRPGAPLWNCCGWMGCSRIIRISPA